MLLQNGLTLKDTLTSLMNDKLPEKVSYAVRKNLRNIIQATDIFETERLRLCMKYGDLTEDQTQFTIREDEKAAFDSEMGTLMNTMIEFEPHTITTGDFNNALVSGRDQEILNISGIYLEV